VLADRAMRGKFRHGAAGGEIKDAEEDVADAKDEAQRDKLARRLDQLSRCKRARPITARLNE